MAKRKPAAERRSPTIPLVGTPRKPNGHTIVADTSYLPMIIQVINLSRNTERMERFQKLNKHLNKIRRFSAVDGSQQDLAKLIQAKRIDASIIETYTTGALGNALSHIALWDSMD